MLSKCHLFLGQRILPMRDDVRRPEQKEESKPAVSDRMRRNVRLVGLGALIVIAAWSDSAAWGHAQRQMAALATLNQQEDEVPSVRVQRVGSTDAPRMLDLPGSMEAFDGPRSMRARPAISRHATSISAAAYTPATLARHFAAPDLDQQLAPGARTGHAARGRGRPGAGQHAARRM